MTKLVVLKLEEEDSSKGVKVWLEIGEEGDRPSIEMTGFLPASDLLQIYDKWQDGYHRLGRGTSRVTHIATIIDGDITPEQCLENAELVRSRLNTWLCSPSFVPLWNKCRQELNTKEEVRVLIRTNSESLRKLPWQLWSLLEDYPLAEVGLSATEYEQLVSDSRPRDQKSIKILAILGDSTGINIDKDRQLLENLPDAKTTFLVEPQLEQISDQLWEQSWDILFFAGHSRSEGVTGRIYINKTDSLRIDELKRGLEKAVRNGLQLAIFNSCDGLGLGRALERLQIPQLIVMREPVPDLVAQRYLKYFLQAFLIENKNLYLAERTARKRLEDLERKFPCASWLPVIFQHPYAIPPTRDRLRGVSTDSSTARDTPTQLSRQELPDDRHQLLARVKDEVSKRLEPSLPEALPIKLHKEKQPQQVIPYWDVDVNTSNQLNTPLPPNTEIIDVFDQEAIAGKLLILGAPGSGKTITLLELAKKLIARAELDPNQPMPVLLNLSSWKNDNQTIAQWLVAELKSNYNIPRNIGKRWLDNWQLLPLLDGLDELKERQKLGIEAINRFEQKNRLQPIVVCTRLEEYKLCHIKLQLNEAICLKPLSFDQIQQYLEQAKSQLWQSIEDDRSLCELTKSPLLLRMMTLASQEILPREWQGFNSFEERRQYLFDVYIRSMLAPNNRKTCYASGKEPTSEQTQRWLSYLAKMLEKEAQTEFLIEKMQPHWLQNRNQKRLYRTVVGLNTGLIFGFSMSLGNLLIKVLVVVLSEGPIWEALWGLIAAPIEVVITALGHGLLWGLIGGLFKGWTYRLIGGLILGAICGLIAWLDNSFENLLDPMITLLMGGIIIGMAEKVRTVETLKWSWIRAKRGIVYGLMGGGAIGIICALFYGLSTGVSIDLSYLGIGNGLLEGLIHLPLFVLLSSLSFALLIGLPIGAVFGGVPGPSIDIETTAIPNQGIWQSLANAKIYALIGGLICGSFYGLTQIFYIYSAYENLLMFGLYNSLYYILIVGTIGGLIPGFACIQHFSLRTVLCWRGLIPWNYARFLNYATDKRLLQKVGGRYRFIHALLQEHFAQM
ncbi:MAG: hypothetical protein CLLPBCKN_007092 [Chroococcidiopsis cubana SAG 39.79]|uniref:NACHT domain-containing protein n=1 Tax=Chroococcidiopsis cubana SAG 39.79 TaxID=388085 RepID=A0AB37UBM9_9CYAN|nr:CHAT domain-containing protein [Chroococcidiopsis cubana]MDZ4877657.1 hypothetical protein [Chroococcidiopsis cubana SAG 39.79]PSB63549.1 hypothetical protein C7B79_13455 [Chroococcidiopsis cubana CCALA 043]RUT04556.1 hypothetical protein DSM107010_57360 [Chroococcidiopsis cubana SAG 39.79]